MVENLRDALVRQVGNDIVDRAGLRVERAGARVTVSLARPEKRNAQRPETWRTLAALGEVLDDLPGERVRLVVVGGDGPSFSAGIDLAVLGEQVGGELP